jgi:hypothetical protein
VCVRVEGGRAELEGKVGASGRNTGLESALPSSLLQNLSIWREVKLCDSPKLRVCVCVCVCVYK